jgi:hypothetical protein
VLVGFPLSWIGDPASNWYGHFEQMLDEIGLRDLELKANTQGQILMMDVGAGDGLISTLIQQYSKSNVVILSDIDTEAVKKITFGPGVTPMTIHPKDLLNLNNPALPPLNLVSTIMSIHHFGLMCCYRLVVICSSRNTTLPSRSFTFFMQFIVSTIESTTSHWGAVKLNDTISEQRRLILSC